MSTIEVALEELRRGRPIVVPTDTVYGIAVLSSVPGAIDEIYRIKGRPSHKPIPLLAARREALEDVVVFSRAARVLAERFWPGPLTMVLPRTFTFAADLGGTGVQHDVAVRIPAQDAALDLLGRCGPLAVTSANPSGAPPATTVEEAREQFEDVIDVFIDGGICDGAPSSVVKFDGDVELLRHGALSLDEVRAALA